MVLYFSEADYQKRGLNFFLGEGVGGKGAVASIETVMVVILLSLLFNYDNLIFKLHQKNVATLTKDGFLLADSKLEVCQE